jgi:hypothetical protein
VVACWAQKDADALQAVGDERENGAGNRFKDCDTSSSSLEDDAIDEDGATTKSAHSSCRVFMLDDMEVQQKEVERQVFFELVFRRDSTFVPTPIPRNEKWWYSHPASFCQ